MVGVTGRCARGVLGRAGQGMLAVAASGMLLVGVAGCSGEVSESVRLAEANVAANRRPWPTRRRRRRSTERAFCDSGATYITALDRYGDVLDPDRAHGRGRHGCRHGPH